MPTFLRQAQDKLLSVNNQKGFIPLIPFIVAGIILAAGGSYAVKSGIIAINKGEVSLNLSKISSQKRSFPDSSNSESSTKSQSNQNSLTDKPNEEGVYDAPIFYIKPPLGWVKQEKDNIITLTAPDKDKEKVGNKTANVSPRIEIYITKQNATTMDDFVKATKSLSEDVEYLSDKRLLLNGHEAHFMEAKNTKEGVKMHSASYLLIKDGFEFHVKGGTFDSTWDKRKNTILGSMSSFRFKQEDSANEQQTNSTAEPMKISDYDLVFGSKEELSYRNPYKLKPPIAFSMKEPANWTKSVPSVTGGKGYQVEFQGAEETQTGKNGTTRISRPIISITMTYMTDNDWYLAQNKIKATENVKEWVFFDKKGYMVEKTLEDYKTKVKTRNQAYYIYEKNYEIMIFMASLESTWDKWYPSMKKVIDSFKFL